MPERKEQPHTAEANAAEVAEVFLRHGAFVRKTLSRLGVEPANLDDAVQDVFVVILRRIDDYDRKRPLGGWLWGIARRVAAGYRRGQRRADRLAAALPAPQPGRGPEEQAALSEATAVLDEFLAKLDPERCDVFVLSEVHGLTGPEIAERLGIKLNTAYSRLRHARAELKRTIAQVRARDAKGKHLAGVAAPLVPRMALGAASVPAMIAVPAALLGLSLIGNALLIVWRVQDGPSSTDVDTAAANCEPAIAAAVPSRPWDDACGDRRRACEGRLTACRTAFARCETEVDAMLPWSLRFDAEPPNPEAEATIDPILDRTHRAFDGVDVTAECRGPVCRLDIVTSDATVERVHEGGDSPQQRLQTDPAYRDLIEGAHFQAGVPTNDLVTKEGVWLETTWLKLAEDDGDT